ncbi:class I adenylate-forming enzyme family protein [Massilia jejuensis]|uniref:Class I adenylate-forming enzyme family protein n=1 Tax=Massilia jejuensis TaxID=648894 RepID=A0ABW0PKH8_9BURK
MDHLLTISDAVATQASLYPAKLGAKDSRRTLTYAQWHERATNLAQGLMGIGLQKGDRVGILAYNRIEWMEIYVALARAGMIAVPINFRLTAPEISYILDNCEADALISGPEFNDIVGSIRKEASASNRHYVVLDSEPDSGWIGYENLMRPQASEFTLPEVHSEETCALLYTSGTTGRPKGVIRNHTGNALIALATALEMGFTRDDTALLVMPMCHANSIYFAMTFIHIGGTCIIDDKKSFDPEELLAVLAKEKVTFTSLVPTHYIMVLALPVEVKSRYDMSNVGKLLVSSAPVRKETKRAILDYFSNGKLYELYGSTEAGWVTLLRPDEQLEKLGSVGREWVASGLIRIVDENGMDVPDGQVGELFSRTPYVFSGYWKNPEKTAQAFRGEWCSVGDMGRRDEDGYIWLVDRKNNMIISGGENVYPSEVESVIGGLSKVKDVAVIGLPDEKWGERVHAVIVLHDGQQATEAEVQAWCRTSLAGYKTPRSVSFITDAEMPRTATGKILHRALRQQFSAARDVAA